MTIREHYFGLLTENYAEGLAVMEGKNVDYAEDQDPFSNIRFASMGAGISMDQGFIFLQCIKIARLKNLLVNNRTPKNEAVEDTIGDGMNYHNMHKTYRQLKDIPDNDYLYSGAPSDDEVPEGEDDVWSGEAEPAPSLGEKLKAFLFPLK